MRRAVAIALTLVPAIASASPPYPLEELLARGETVMIAHVVPGARVTVQPTRVLRGAASPQPMTLALVDEGGPRFVDGDYLVFSQGDRDFGPPLPQIRFDQGIEGQRGYRGWIALPLERDRDGQPRLRYLTAEKRMDFDHHWALRELEAFVRRHPYDPRRP